MDKDIFRELCMAHALGALEGKDALLFQEALAHADEERLAIYAEAVALAQNLSLAAPPSEPSAAVKDRLMARIGAAASPSRARAPRVPPAPSPWKSVLDFLAGARGFGPGLAFASLALGVGVLAYAFSLKGDLGRRESALEHSQARITALEDSVARKDALLEVLLSHNLQVAVMAGGDMSPKGYGKMIWCPKRRCGILHVANLPAVPEGRAYQLWLMREGGPVNAGLFRVGKTTWDGDLFRIQGMAEVDRGKVKGFLITLEPEAGSPAPAGDAYLRGSVLL